MADREFSLRTDPEQVAGDGEVRFGGDEGWTLAESRNVAVENGSVRLETGPPDSDSLHARYDFSDLDAGTTGNVPDLGGSGFDLTRGSFSGVSADINGVQAGEFDGVSDGLWYDGSFDDITPATVYAVVELADDASTSDHHYAVQMGDTNQVLGWIDDGEWICHFGNYGGRGTGDTSVQLLTGIEDGTETIIRENGQETDRIGDSAGRPFTHLGVGSRNPDTDANHFHGAIGEVLVYSGRRTGEDLTAPEEYLADRWGISLA